MGCEPSSRFSPLDSVPERGSFSRGPMNELPRRLDDPSSAVVGSLRSCGVAFAYADDVSPESRSSAGPETGSRGTISFGKTSGHWTAIASGRQIVAANNEAPLLKDSKVPKRSTNWRVKLHTASTRNNRHGISNCKPDTQLVTARHFVDPVSFCAGISAGHLRFPLAKSLAFLNRATCETLADT